MRLAAIQFGKLGECETCLRVLCCAGGQRDQYLIRMNCLLYTSDAADE